MHGSFLDPYANSYARRTRGMTVSEIRALFAVASRPEVVSLAGGMPNLSALPMDDIAEMMSALVLDRGPAALQYGGGQGEPQLREQITEVMALEGISASADDVVVTVGSQHALDLICRIFLDPGDVIVVEGPSYVGALGTFASAEAEVVHVPMDADGLVPAALAEMLARLRTAGRRAKFVYTIPNFHNPAGVTLTSARRDEILAIARREEVLLIEDNPYGLLGFEVDAPTAMRARDDEGVIYLGSFSKTLAPGLRVGWALAPSAVCEKLILASEAQVLCPPMWSQEFVGTFLATQPWQQQVKRFRGVYHTRRDAMLSALEQFMPEGCTWTRPAGGFYVWLTLPPGLDAKVMLARAVNERVAYVPGVGFYADGNGTSDLRLSYCFPEPDRIREGVRRLATVVQEEMELLSLFDS